MKKIVSIHVMLIGILMLFPFNSYSIQNLSEEELGEIAGQDGATFIFDAFDFYMTSPGMEYLDVHPEVSYDDVSDTITFINAEGDANRSSIYFDDIVISDGNNGPVVMSGNLDFDGYSQTIDGVTYTLGKLDFYNLDLTMDVDVSNIAFRLTGNSQIVDLGGMHINGGRIDDLNIYFGAADNNTGLAAEIDLRLYIETMQVDALKLNNNTITFKDIMVAGYFDRVPGTIGNNYLEQDYDPSLPLPYTEVPGIWSESRAASYAGSNTSDYYKQLINANRYKPNWTEWVFDNIAHGTLKLGDVASGNPLRMDFTVDTNYYIPFPYDIVCGEAAVDNRVEWYEPVSGDFFSDARGWRDGKDNYLQDGTNYQPVRNPRYGKSYVSMDAHLSGSLRMISDTLTDDPSSTESFTDIIMIEGLDLQIHTEIPGYGYGDSPNSIPRPYPNPTRTAPQYDAPFNEYWPVGN